jgi:hypothetical protein
MSVHIITNSLNGRFKCEFCGTEEAPPFMPAPINVIIDAMDYFIDQHKDCKRPQAETVMSEYVKGFDSGYGYVLNEIEVYIKQYPDNKFVLEELLAHLKMEDRKESNAIRKTK